VSNAVAKVIEKGWVCSTIAPSHGVIWRHDQVPAVIDAYDRLTADETEDKLIVAYSTMWGSTDILAREIADGAGSAGVEVMLFDVSKTPMSHLARHLLDSRALLLGSPTLHHGMLYRIAGLLQYVGGLKPKDKVAGVFGSFGWSGGATKQMRARLEEIGFELPLPELTCKYKPSAEELEAARAWGAQFAGIVKTMGAEPE
jgi:flavorubredoxin